MSALSRNRDSSNRFATVEYYCSQLPAEGWVELCEAASAQGYTNPSNMSFSDFSALVTGSDMCYAYQCLESFREREERSSTSRFVNFVSASRSTDPTGGVHETTSRTSYSEGRMPFDGREGGGYERLLSREVLNLQNSIREIRESMSTLAERLEASVERLEARLNSFEASIDLRLNCLESAADVRAMRLADLTSRFEDDVSLGSSFHNSLSNVLMDQSLVEFIGDACEKVVKEFDFARTISVGENETVLRQLIRTSGPDTPHIKLIKQQMGEIYPIFLNQVVEVGSPLRSSALAKASTSTSENPASGEPVGDSDSSDQDTPERLKCNLV